MSPSRPLSPNPDAMSDVETEEERVVRESMEAATKRLEDLRAARVVAREEKEKRKKQEAEDRAKQAEREEQERRDEAARVAMEQGGGSGSGKGKKPKHVPVQGELAEDVSSEFFGPPGCTYDILDVH